MPVTTRERLLGHGPLGSFKWKKVSWEPNWREVEPQIVNMGAQVTESEGHRMIRKGLYDGGGPFYTVRLERNFPTRHIEYEAADNSYFVGDVGTPLPESTLPSDLYAMTPRKFKSNDMSDLIPLGTIAIAQCAPTNPNANLGTSLAEMYREGVPSIPGMQAWKRRTEIVKAAASEFLNAEFGWLPLVSDVKDTASSIRHMRDILKQYQRDAGKNVRRSFAFPIEESEDTNELVMAPSTIIYGATGYPAGLSEKFGSMKVTQTIRKRSRKWFDGCFTYGLPDQSDSWSGIERIAAEADKLFGTDITPDVLWELTPWSWAVDWFTNTGDVIHNVTNFAEQGLVMRYGYMMEEYSVNVEHTFTPDASENANGFRRFPTSSYSLVSKRRVPANPFGFGLTEADLSPTQIAIAVAVGITQLL
jgi:hypothetical protein